MNDLEKVKSRIDELGQLEDGFFDGKVKAPTKEVLDFGLKIIEELNKKLMELPDLFPYVLEESGGLRMETNEWEITIHNNNLLIEVAIVDPYVDWFTQNQTAQSIVNFIKDNKE